MTLTALAIADAKGVELNLDELAPAVLAAAATCFGDVPGVEVIDEGDLVRSNAPGHPQPYVNGIARLRVAGVALEDRVRAIEPAYRAAGLPTSWWVDDWTAPTDAADRLLALGMRPGGAEAVMVVDLGAMPESVVAAEQGAARAGVVVAPVETIADLDAWIGVMARSYGWSDPRKAAQMRDLYDPRTAHGRDGRRVHVLAWMGGVAVGAASLFLTAGQGWVTNVGTIPAARGRGVGAAVTSVTLRLALERGDPTAWLAASDMGEPVYRRLGFRTVGRVAHLIGPGQSPNHASPGAR